MNLDQFIAEHRPRWNRFEELLGDAENLPEAALGHKRIREIVKLYREVSSDLNWARSLTADPRILERLNQLAGRGYRFVYGGTRRKSTAQALWRFVASDIPRAFTRESNFVLAAAVAFLLGAAIGFAGVLSDTRTARDLIPEEFFTESPRQRVARIESGEERVDSAEKAADYGAYLFTRNIQVSFLAFAAGALTIIGGLWVLFYNGVILGAVAAMYVLDGVQIFFLAWVGPHGALELPAIVFAGAAGLRAGAALLAPGDLSRGTSARRAFPSVWRMMLAVSGVLVMAGLIEGSFSQFTARAFPYWLKIAVAAILFVLLMGYLFIARKNSGVEEDGGEE